MWLKSLAVLLICAVCTTAGVQWRTKEQIKTRQNTLLFLNILEKAAIYEIQNFTATGYRSEMFNQLTKSVRYTPDMARKELEEYTPEQSVLGCLACRTYLATLIRDRRAGASEEELANSAINMCRVVTDFTLEVCEGVVRLNTESLVYIIDARPTLSATSVCGMVLQGECGTLDPAFSFTVNVNPGPQITGPKTVASPRSPGDMKIVHVTDLHYDENYLEGSLGNCINPVCCRRADGIPTNPADRAGFWGDYRNCDTPWRAVEDTLRRIRREHPDAELIYHTGDIVDHGVWETTEAGNRRIMDRVFNMFKEVFGSTPVFHVIGNHEAQPTNVFAPPSITRPSLSARWLYDYTANTWQRHGWLSGDAVNTVRSGGFYTHLVRPGFRIIGLNNNDCYIYNWWVMYSRDEARSNMQWLHDTLLAAERANERVHILKHIPSGGGSCFKFWSREYRRVIDRFHNIIGAQFNGHSHRDEFEVFYDSATGTHAINVAWNGGGATAFSFLNPNYHVMYVDRTHYQVTDYESYIYSITEANRTPAQNPRWFRQYSFRESFTMVNLSPASLDRLVFDLSRSRTLLRRYYEYKVKAADPLMQAGCDDTCLRSQVCSIVVNEHDDLRRCNQVLAVFGTVN